MLRLSPIQTGERMMQSLRTKVDTNGAVIYFTWHCSKLNLLASFERLLLQRSLKCRTEATIRKPDEHRQLTDRLPPAPARP